MVKNPDGTKWIDRQVEEIFKPMEKNKIKKKTNKVSNRARIASNETSMKSHF